MEASPTTNRYGLHGNVMGSRMLMAQPDVVLCKLCARGSDDAFDVLHARYRQQVFAFVFHLLNRRDAVDDAEDLTQDVFGKAFASIRSRHADGSFKHWLFTIARNTTLDHIRARKPQGVSIDEASDSRREFANVVSISSQVENRAEFAWLVETMQALPERQREALVMRELGGLTHAEIAGELDTSVDATKQLIKRGRKSVGESAERSGYRSRKLGKDLAMAAPIMPLAAAGLGLTASGASAAAGFGAAALSTKVAAVALTAVAIGGSGAAVKEVASSRGAERASSSSLVSDKASDSSASAERLGLLGVQLSDLGGATGSAASASARELAAAKKAARGSSAAARAKSELRKRTKASKANAKRKGAAKSGASADTVRQNSDSQNGSGTKLDAPAAAEKPGGAQAIAPDAATGQGGADNASKKRGPKN